MVVLTRRAGERDAGRQSRGGRSGEADLRCDVFASSLRQQYCC